MIHTRICEILGIEHPKRVQNRRQVNQAILDSDDHDTVLTEIPDITASQVWSGAMSRVKRNRFVERWSGREWLLRQNLSEAAGSVRAARKNGDTDEVPLFYGQDAGLISDLPPAATIIERLVEIAF